MFNPAAGALNVSAGLLKNTMENIRTALPDDPARELAAKAISAALDDPEVKKKGYEDVRKLATEIVSVRQSMITVAGGLVSFDNAKFKDAKGKVVVLGPKWQPYIRTFDEALQGSLEQATQAISTIRAITSVFGDVTPEDRADLMDELKQFIEMCKKKESSSPPLKNTLVNLADKVKAISDEMDAALSKDSESIKTELQHLKDQLRVLRKDLDELDEKIHSVVAAVISAVGVGFGAAGTAIMTLNPIAIVGVIDSSISAIGTGIALKKAMNDRETRQGEIDKTNREINDLYERSELLKKHRGNFEGIDSDLRDITPKMGVIGDIWQTIHLDMQAICNHLGKSEAAMSKFFLTQLTLCKDLYRHLIFLLEMYVEQVRSGGI